MATSMLSRISLGLLVASWHAQAAVNFDTTNGQPWGGTPAAIPGLIEAEYFDTGGEGVGYHDTTSKNVRNAFRVDEGVDIHAHDGGLDVGWNREGEYLRYTIDVEEDVKAFTFHFRVASLVDTGAFRIVAGGVSCDDYATDLSGLVSIPSTGSYNRYEDFEVNGQGVGGLSAGVTQIWLCAVSREFNLDYFTMTAVEDHGGPWGGVAVVVPGTVQAEEFDEGGEGVGYSDSTEGNKKGAFRPDEDVDINAMDDAGYNVGHITAGEFLRYTLDVTKKMDDVYFNFRIASSNGLGSFRIVSGGTDCNDYTIDLSGLVEVPSTGGNTRYEDLKVNGNGTGGLSARETVIWLCVESKSFNIDYFTISKTGVVDPDEPPTPDPYGGVAPPVPGVIQAEEFDFGGEGVGYSDTTDGNAQGEFRPDEDVDIDELKDGGYYVGSVAAGEYLRYSVDVTNSMDDVYFTFRVASAGDLGSLRVVTGGSDCDDYTTDLSGLVEVPNTGGNNIYQDVAVNGNGNGGIKKASDAIIWLCIESKSFNIDYFTMSKTSTPPTVRTPSPSEPLEDGGPWEGVAATVPGTIQAEEFDEGGEGVAYSDSSQGNNKGAFRPHEDVDINVMDDGGYYVGYITAGEYLRYTIDVTNSMSDVYFTFRVAASTSTGSFRIVTGGTDCDDFTTDLSGNVEVPATGGNLRYQDLAVNGNGSGGLKKGTGIKIWLCVESKSFNIDYFTMSKTAT